jgi:hypothetical protein
MTTALLLFLSCVKKFVAIRSHRTAPAASWRLSDRDKCKVRSKQALSRGARLILGARALHSGNDLTASRSLHVGGWKNNVCCIDG